MKATEVEEGAGASPVPTLSLGDAVAITVGIVVGAGIFRTPSLVAANADIESAVLLIWLAGGVVSLIGALYYAELSITYPHTGGDYHYLTRAYGRPLAFLYPLTPLLFCAACLYMLQSSLAYTGVGALAGVAVLLSGAPVLLLARRRQQRRLASAGYFRRAHNTPN